MGLIGGSEGVAFRVELELMSLTLRRAGESEGDGGRRERSSLSARRWARLRRVGVLGDILGEDGVEVVDVKNYEWQRLEWEKKLWI